jgi:hypothetical protein
VRKPRPSRLFCPSSMGIRVRMHPLALAESGWVWVGAGSRPTGLRTGRAIPGLRRDAALPVRQNTRQGREGGALPKPFLRLSVSGARQRLILLIWRAHIQHLVIFASPGWRRSIN